MDFCKQYPSGLRLVAKQTDNYTVSVGVFVNVGSVREDSATNGYSHFIEHLVFKGTKRRTCLQISEEIDDIGANINAYTAKDATCFYTKSAFGDLERCLDILSDLYFNATLPQQELQREKGVVVEEIKMCRDTPDDVSQDLVSQALFFDQPLGLTILGNPKNIEYSDRHSLLKFKKKHYIPSATVVAVCGKFDETLLDKLVLQYFEQHCVGTQPLVEEPTAVYRSRFLHKFKPIEQSHIQLAWGGFALSDERRIANTMLASILGGGLSSRLNQVVREQHGLAYSVYAYPSYYTSCGTFEIYVGLSPQNTAKVCGLLRNEICRLVDDGITEKELQRARMQAVNAVYMNAESNMTLMRLYGRSMLKLNEMYSVDADVDRYNAVTLQQINDVARTVFARPHASAYVGPKIADYNAPSKLKI